MEIARVLNTLINENRIPRPKRTIRFIIGPEFSGTGPWVKAHKETDGEDPVQHQSRHGRASG